MALSSFNLILAPAFLAVAQVAPPAPPALDGAVSICEIQRHPEAYLGKVVTVSATYLTDSHHYEYLTDSSCSAPNILDIGFVVPERDTSVQAFESAQASECKRTVRRGLCVLEATVTMRGRVSQTRGGHLLPPDHLSLVIDPHSVLSYQIQDER